ncbi:hypothetical protein BDV24DRAFT_178140 [Aspergillus arachidicola]|uniref:Protein kinase domain-containing protein n=1 Tax=Aspergillus arachidicola TaxID=656916 RepID=A0A2G7FQG7_9EURO|nr:hypothetical protein BDV24DRAFT_178140 [Aspergillus arachidicola]PIG82051.1 hypothetical protein AARAC_000268 [Aspergillus arachidicola]
MFALPIGGKPGPPYTVGWRCTVHSHEPPRPTLVTKDNYRNFAAGRLEKAQLSPVERCLRHPPLPGLDKPHKVDLEIIEVKKGGDNHNSQVVVVEVLGHIQRLEKGRRAVAKFYDALYFDDDKSFLNPFACMDRHYTHESAAYITLADLMGKKIPEFYGSFSEPIPVDESCTRTDYNQLSRQVPLKSAIDFESLVYERDISLTDFTLRNIILVDSASCSEQPDLVFLDFGGALFGRIRHDAVAVAYRVNLSLETYISPLLRWAKLPSDFDQWVD